MKLSCKNPILRGAVFPLIAAGFFAFSPVPSGANGLPLVNLHSFDLFLNGATPYAGLVQGTNGLFYGTTFQGGADNAGVVFEVASNGTVRVLYSFTNGVDGGFPEAGLVLANDGNFYGTTFDGGTNGTGVVFKMTPAGGFNPLYSFTTVNDNGENQDGANPSAGLIQATDGNLYGVTSTGGANGSGTLFKVSLGGSFGLVYTFSVVDFDGYNDEGSAPEAALVEGSDGNFYGTADEGGSNGLGAVFEYVVSQSTVSPLHSFRGAGDGSKPLAALVQGTDGDFYGTASEGGTNGYGSVFKISGGGALTPLYSFTDGTDGGNPVASLVQGANGNFFGTSTGPQTGFGTVFQMRTNGALSTLYTFTGGDDGAYPEAALVQAGEDNFYGTTSYGGTNNSGAVFNITASGAFARVMSFIGGADGDEPEAPLVQATNGNFYGTTYLGGTGSDGVVFEMSVNGALSSLYSFTNGQDGANPAGGLVQGSDGNLYGTTYTGGVNHDGVLFKMTTQGTLTVLHSLTNRVEGSHPLGRLMQGTNGNFYGTTYQGGASTEGAIFEMTPGGAVTPVYAFTGGADGAYPKAGLVQGIDGNLYGTASLGGTSNYGTVYKITYGGMLTPLYSFTNGVDGATPECQLALGADGNFYGTTAAGGSKGYGVIFRISAGGSFTPLYSFTNGIDGAAPEAGLALGVGGKFYGTSSAGGTYSMGTLFEMTTNGAFTAAHSFTGTSDGAVPVAALVLGSDSNYYGTASSGGASDGGTAFRLDIPGPMSPVLTWATPADITYGAALSSSQLDATASVPGSFAYTPTNGSILSSGTHALSVVFTPTDTVDYLDATDTVSLVVSPASLIVTASNRAKIYGQTVTFAGTEFMTSGLINGATVTRVTLTSSGSAPAATVTGSPYDIVPSAAVGTGLTNYTIIYVHGELAVSPAALTVTASNRAKTYGQTVTFAGTEFTTQGLLNSDAVNRVTLTSSGAVATATVTGSPYAIVASAAVGVGLANYTLSYVNGVLTVGEATPVTTWTNPAPVIYGTALTSNQLNATVNVPGTYVYNPTNGTVLNTGTNTLSVIFTPTDSADYNSVTDSVSLVVVPALLTVRAANTNRVYGQVNPLFTGTIVGVTNGDNITAAYSCSATVASPVGIYPIVPDLLDPNDRQTNYMVSYVNGILTVGEATPITTWINPAPVIYGTALTSNQLNATVNVPGTYVYYPTNGTVLNTGTNTLSVIFTPTDSADYNSVTDSVSLVVLPALLTVRAANTNRVYGQANPVFTGTIVGVTNGDNITAAYSCSATATSPAGTYPIVPNLVDPNDRQTNYSVSYVNGVLTVGEATPVTTWTNPAPVIYGTALTSNQLNATVNVPGNYVYNPTNGTVLNTGTNTLSVIFTPTDSADYNSVTDSVSLVVLPALLTVRAANTNRVYGQANPVFTGTIVGVTNGDNITAAYSCSATVISPVGAYPVVPGISEGTDLTNYTITYADGTLTINPAALTVMASNRTKAYGQTVTFAGTEFSAGGLVNGDTVTNVTLTSSGAAATATVAGSPYAIVPGAALGTGLTNYTITYVNGTLTVTPSQPAILSANQSGNLIIFTWSAATTQTYQIQCTTDLSQGTWTILGGPIAATNSTATASDFITNSQMFYRVVLAP